MVKMDKTYGLKKIVHSKWFARRGRVAVVLAVFGVTGVMLLVQGHAATPAAAFEAESGQLTGNASTVSDAGASAGAAVQFGTPPSGTILFQDDFNGAAGSKFDTTKWHQYSACGYNSSAAYGDIVCGENETLDGQGHLIIPATPSTGQSLMTGDNFKFEYGTASAWIKFPPQAGYWPAFWTLNNNADGTNLPHLGEVDAMEGYTTWEDGVIAGSGYHAGFHNWSNVSGEPQTGGGPDACPQPGVNLSTAFHKYTVKIAPNSLSFYFDDKLCGNASYGPANNPGDPYGFGPSVTNGNWLILTLAVGGAGGQQTPASQNAQMLVDRVEVRSN